MKIIEASFDEANVYSYIRYLYMLLDHKLHEITIIECCEFSLTISISTLTKQWDKDGIILRFPK